MRPKRIITAVLSIACLFSIAPAQQPEPARLALEIYYYPNEPPAYQPVSPVLRGSWFSRFRRIKADGPNDLPVSAVDIKSIRTAEGVRVTVAVLFGELHQKQEAIGTYTIREGERVKVDGLGQFGVDPFTIAVVPFSPSNLDLPELTSKAKSIDYVGIQPGAAMTPSFRIAVRNLSSRNLRAIYVRVLKGGDPQRSLMPQGIEGAPLMPLGNAYEFSAPVATRAVQTATGFTQVILPSQVIEVSTAIFVDGSFEGDAEPALNYSATLRGNKIQLARVIELFQRTRDAQADPATKVEALKSSIAKLSTEADPALAQEIIGEFGQPVKTAPADLKRTIEIGMRAILSQAMNAVQQFQLRNPQPDPNDLGRFLALYQQRYEAWLSRL